MKVFARWIVAIAASTMLFVGCDPGPEVPDPVDVDIEIPDFDEDGTGDDVTGEDPTDEGDATDSNAGSGDKN